MTQQEFDTMLNIELGSASAVMNKRARLNTSLGSKRNRLYGLEENNFASLDNSVTNINGQQFSNSNKVWNSDTAAQKQQKMSDVVDQQIYKRDDGSMYQIDPYSGSEVDFVGDTRRFYMYGTKTSDDEIKAGLAKSGFGTSDIRYDRTLAESLGASRGKGYGWESGPEGVDINKKQLDILLPFSTATEYEGYLHGNTDAIGNRTVLRDNQAGRDARGSGSSEYYSDVVGLLGDTSRDYNADTNYSDFRGQLGGKEMSRGDKLNLAIEKASSGSIDALQSGLVKLYGNATGALGTMLEYTGDKMDNESIMEAGAFLSKRNEYIQKNADSYYGYHDSNVGKFGNAAKNLSEGNLGDAWSDIASVNFMEEIAKSAPMMAALSNPYTASAYLLGNIDESVKEARKNEGGEITGTRLAIITAAEIISLATEKLAIKGIFGDDAFNAIRPLLGKTNPNIIKAAIQDLTARGGAIITGGSIMEGSQEIVQGTLDVIAQKYGTEKYKTIEKAFEGRGLESLEEFIGGATTGGAMKGVFDLSSVPSSIKSVVDASMEAREEANSKKHGQTFESIDDAKNKIVVGNEIISQNDVTISELTSNINTISGSETVEDLQTAVEESDISDGTKQGILGEIERGIDAELDVNEMKGRINSLVDSHIKQLESDSKHKKLAIESAEEALRTTESDDPVKSDDVVKLEQEISTQESIIRDNETVASETEATQEMIDAHKVDSDKLSAMNTELKELNVQSIKDEVASKIEVEKSKVSAEKKGIVNRILSKIDGKISKGKRSAVAKLESVLKTMDDAALDVLLDGKDGVDSIVTQFGEKANINASDVLKSINALRDLRKKSSAKFGISNKDEKIKLSSTGVKELDAEIDILNVQSQAMDELIKKSVNMKKEDIKKVKDEIYQNMSNSIVAMTQSIGRMTEQEINDFSVEEYIKSIPTIRDVDGTESKKMVTAKGFITGAYEAQVLVHKANKKTSESDAGRRRQVIKIATAKTVNTQSEIDKARANIVVLEEKGKLDSDAVARLKKMLDKVEKRSQVKLKEDKTKAAEKTEEVTEEVIEDINEQIDNDDSLTMAEKEMTKAIAMDNVKGQMAAGVEISPESIESIEWYNIKIDEAKDGKITIEHKCPGE